MLKRTGSNFRSKVSGRMMFIYAVVLIAFFGISIPAAAAHFSIHVYTLEGDYIYLEDVVGGYEIRYVKELLEEKTGIPARKQQLFFRNTELEDGHTLEYYDIKDVNCMDVNWKCSLDLMLIPDSYPPAPEPTTVPVYEEPAFYALPEDEIGAYALREDGTKEYLLFHTYDICMDWLASDELCAGFDRCFHKDGK